MLWPALAISALAGLAATAPSAMAADCTGSQQIIGQGASFQKAAQTDATNGWIVNAGCVVGTQDSPDSPFLPGDDLIYYKPTGSGSGINAFGGNLSTPGVRDQSISFIGTDDPMTPAQVAAANEGNNPTSANPDGDDGVFHTIPALQGAVAVIVNVPDTCRPASFSNFRPVYPFGGAGTTNNALEEVFSGERTTWGDFGYVLKSNTSTPCPVAFKRVVRRDNSGTTFNLKKFFESTDKNNDSNWAANDTVAEDNTIWLGQGRDRDGTCDGVDSGTPLSGAYVCTGTGSGNSFLADVVAATDGSIGYSDLATARVKDFDFDGASALADDTYWLKVYQPGSNPVLRDPALDQVNGWKATATPAQKGSNCSKNQRYLNIPSNTKSDWSDVIMDQSTPNVYPLCLMSYLGAWEDMEDVYPTVNYTELQNRQAAVTRYLEYVLGEEPVGVNKNEGQTILPFNDYAPLSKTPLTRAKAFLTTFNGFDKSPDRAPVRP